MSIPNGPGIGNVLCYSSLIKYYSLKLGKRLKILTAPINPIVGKSVNDNDNYPIWKNNPYIQEIVDANRTSDDLIKIINKQKDDTCQFGHVIENICFAYGIMPTKLKPHLYLSFEEQAWALDYLSSFKRPIICIHPYGKTAPKNRIDWFEKNWNDVIKSFRDYSFLQLGIIKNDRKKINALFPDLTLRQTFSIIWASDFFIGFDSSLAHIATAFEKKAIVLWDVKEKEVIEHEKELGFAGSMMLRWAYPQNTNLMMLGERNNEIYDICCSSIKNFFI